MSEETLAVKPLTIREKTLLAQRGQGHKRKRVTMVVNGEKLEADVQCPGVALRRSLAKQYKDDSQRQDTAALIECTFIPGTNEKLYIPADLDVLLGEDEPTGGWLDTLSQAMAALLEEQINISREAAKK